MREWNPKTFFRRLSAETLGLFGARTTGALVLDGHGPLYEQFYRGWKALKEGERVRLESELGPLNDLCTLEARPYLEELAQAVWSERRPELLAKADQWSVHDLGLRLFLEAPDRFSAIHQSYAIDRMDHFREYRGRAPFSGPAPEAQARMKETMCRHFREHGRGRVVVEDFVNPEKFALFVYHEDHIRPVDRFNDQGALEPDWRRPVIRLAAVFHYDTSTLLVKASRSAERDKLRDLFAEFIVGDASYFEDPGEQPKFCFDPLRDPAFDFPTRGIDHVEDVSVVHVEARPPVYPPRRIRVDVPTGLRRERLGELLAECGVSLATDAIDGVRFRFCFEGRGRSRFRTVSLLNPNSSNLRDTARDRLIRRYLKEWGFDAKPARRLAKTMGVAVIAA
jgi:hypothetical protein